MEFVRGGAAAKIAHACSALMLRACPRQTLYTDRANPNGVKALVAAEFAGVTLRVPPFVALK
jgi:hypothetical protein